MITNIAEFQKRKENIQKIDKIIIIISILMLAIIPNVVYKKEMVSYSPILTSHAYAIGPRADVFNYYKSILLNMGSLLMISLFSYKIIALKHEIKKDKLNIAIIFFAIIILISSIMSNYPHIAFFGNHDRFEGSFAWFSYLSIFFVLYNTNIEKKYYKFYYLSLVVFIIINAITSITYLYGNNLLDYKWVNNMLGGGLNGFIITTLYNQNFGSGMSAVVFCVSFMYMLLEKNMMKKFLLFVITIISYATLLAMKSAGGFLTIVGLFPVIVIVGFKFRGISALIFSVIVFGVNTLVYKILKLENPAIENESFAILQKLSGSFDKIIILLILLLVVCIIITKFINAKKLFDISLGIVLFSLVIGFLSYSKLINDNKEQVKESSIYKQLDGMTSGRIEIWTRTMELIDDNMIIGSGFDTFPYEIIVKDEEKGVMRNNVFMDKPHNLYLTIMYGSGVLGLVGFLFIMIYIVRDLFIKIVDKIEVSYIYIFGMGVIAYLIQGITNDSFVGTGIILWILAGITIRNENIETE